jgi:hypothetical protein
VNSLLPVLQVHSPDGETFEVELSENRITVGRFREFNDVGLEPDPQRLVGRKAHCIVEREIDGWWVVDNGSVNKTFLQSENGTEVVYGRSPLVHGNKILILGRLIEDKEPLYWELTFFDPLKTERAEGAPSVAYLEYDWIQARLFRVEGSHREEIHHLRPQEHKLLRYMDQRNRANGNVPVMCEYEELITAIWCEEVNHNQDEIVRLVYDLRQKVETDSQKPRFLQTVPGMGYRLVTRPLANQ